MITKKIKNHFLHANFFADSLRDNPLLIQSNTSASRRLKGFVHGNRLPTEGRDILSKFKKSL